MQRQAIPESSTVIPGWRRATEIAEVLGVTERKVKSLVVRGPLAGTYWNGGIIIRESDLAEFIASRRRW